MLSTGPKRTGLTTETKSRERGSGDGLVAWGRTLEVWTLARTAALSDHLSIQQRLARMCQSVGPYSLGQRVARVDRLSQQLHAHLVEQFLAFG